MKFLFCSVFSGSHHRATKTNGSISTNPGVFFYAKMSVSAFFNKVASFVTSLYVFADCYNFHVVRVYARAIQAQVVNHKSFWYGPFGVFIDKAAYSNPSSAKHHIPITGTIKSALPYQTIFSVNHVRGASTTFIRSQAWLN